MEVFRNFRFHAARHLPNLEDSHICKKIHGHTFNLTVHISGEINKKTGFVIDFFDIDTIVKSSILPIIDKLERIHRDSITYYLTLWYEHGSLKPDDIKNFLIKYESRLHFH